MWLGALEALFFFSSLLFSLLPGWPFLPKSFNFPLSPLQVTISPASGAPFSLAFFFHRCFSQFNWAVGNSVCCIDCVQFNTQNTAQTHTHTRCRVDCCNAVIVTCVVHFVTATFTIVHSMRERSEYCLLKGLFSLTQSFCTRGTIVEDKNDVSFLKQW